MGNKLDFNTVSNHLGQYVTDHKKAFIEEVLSQRTRHATLVLEDIYQSQNASAVFRTAECLGIQDIHLIENVGNYTVNKRVLKGADKWLSIFKYNKEINNTMACFKELKSRGYKILATSPAAALTLEEIDVTSKIAIVLGNELHGLSDEARDQADFQVRIPMYGFTESLNLSVSAAICVSN
ncbi:MAG: RNA methyltransferase, partial [Cyclobacteriaceae bacterium]